MKPESPPGLSSQERFVRYNFVRGSLFQQMVNPSEEPPTFCLRNSLIALWKQDSSIRIWDGPIKQAILPLEAYGIGELYSN